MCRILFLLILVSGTQVSIAQKYLSRNGFVSFYSHAAIEDITASNKKVSSAINIATSEIAFSVSVRSFQFSKKLMQEHFNEKYMESEKFPDATFSGKFEGYSPDVTGVQNVRAKGNLTIHGVTRAVDVAGTLENGRMQIRLKAKFIVRLVDHNITIPTMLWQNIAEQVEVRVDVTYPVQ